MAAIAATTPLMDEDRIPTKPKVERGREVGTALDEIMKEEKAHTLIVTLSGDPQELDNELKMARSILSKVTESVLFIRPKSPR